MKRSVLITGTSSGIGFAISKKLLNKGHVVYGLCRRADQVFKNEKGYFPIVCDLRKKIEGVEGLFIDGLICNAGVGALGNLEQLSSKKIEDTISVNFSSHVLLVKHFLAHLKKQKRADILFIGSEAAFTGKRGGSIYCATKFALRGFFQALREECGTSEVKVSQVHPSMVDTDFYKDLSIEPKKSCQTSLQAQDVADVVIQILESKSTLVFEEVLLKPKQYVVVKK